MNQKTTIIDLNTCKPGTWLRTANGTIVVYCKRNSDSEHLIKYNDAHGNYGARLRDGTVPGFLSSSFNIVHVLDEPEKLLALLMKEFPCQSI